MKRYNLAFAVVLALGMMFASSCKDACEKDDPCVNGTCSEVDGEATCTCDSGYEGTTCSTEIRDVVEGNWAFTDACVQGVSTSSVFTASSSSVTKVLISNILGEDLGGDALATVTKSGTSYTISCPSQSVIDVDGDQWTISTTTATLGSSNTSFSWTISLSGPLTESCVQTFNKQ